MRGEHIQKKLLAEADLTITRALEIAHGMEAADKNAKELQDPINKASGQNSVLKFTNYKSKKKCYRCGRDHEQSECKFRDAKCHNCGKQGHIASVCRSKSTSSANAGTKKSVYMSRGSGRKRFSERPSEATNKYMDVDNGLFVVSDTSSQKPISVEMEIDDTKVRMELDTGASVSVMSQETFENLFPQKQISPSSLRLKMYTGEQMQVVGEVQVFASYQSQPPQELPIVIVEGSGPTLLGRNWLHHIRLDWRSIKTVSSQQESLNEMLQRYAEIFTDELGTIKKHTVKLVVAPDANPKFHPPRSVPYALKALVEEELNRLERIGVLEKVDYSRWAASIVVVPKKDGRVRLCGVVITKSQ